MVVAPNNQLPDDLAQQMDQAAAQAEARQHQ